MMVKTMTNDDDKRTIMMTNYNDDDKRTMMAIGFCQKQQHVERGVIHNVSIKVFDNVTRKVNIIHTNQLRYKATKKEKTIARSD